MGKVIRKPVWEAVIRQTGPSDRKVLIVTDDGDRFAVPVNVAVHACKSHEKLAEFVTQFEGLVREIGLWLNEHGDEIERAYIAPEPGGLMFAVVQKGWAFDPAFEDALSDIDFRIAQNTDLDLIKLRAISLPGASEEAVASFLDLSHALVTRID